MSFERQNLGRREIFTAVVGNLRQPDYAAPLTVVSGGFNLSAASM